MAAAPPAAPAEPAAPATPATTNAVTAEGWGPLRIGMTRAEVVAGMHEVAPRWRETRS